MSKKITSDDIIEKGLFNDAIIQAKKLKEIIDSLNFDPGKCKKEIIDFNNLKVKKTVRFYYLACAIAGTTFIVGLFLGLILSKYL